MSEFESIKYKVERRRLLSTFNFQLSTIVGCVQAVVGLGIKLGLVGGLYTAKNSEQTRGVNKWASLNTMAGGLCNYLYTTKNYLFISVGSNFITTFHKTYKGNYELYKLITVIG